MLVIEKLTRVMLLFCSINTQSFVHDKSSSISQFINGNSRDFQKLLRYLSGIVTSTCKVGTGGRFASPSFPGISGMFPTILFYIKMIYHLKPYHHYQFCLYNNSINFLMSYINFDNILADYSSTWLYQDYTLAWLYQHGSTNVLLIFEMYDLNGALFLNATSFSALSFLFAASAKRSIVHFTTIYASL